MHLVQYRNRVPNFGDDLNAELWPRLLPDLFDDDAETGFVGIGTIIGMPCGAARRLHVFSSGIGNDRPEAWRDRQVEYWCVRGPVSARVLGLPEDRFITDGAILTPLAEGFPKAASGTGGTLVIPHFQTLDFPGWPEACAQAGFELLDPRAEPFGVIERIAAAKLVLTESLHGAILADVYGVPWIVFGTSKNFGVTKFVDWSHSLRREFDLAMLPPPNPDQILAFGRPPAPFGETVRFGLEGALAKFDERVLPDPVTWKSRIAPLVKRTPIYRRMLNLNPARTAEALTRLSRSEPCLSDRRLQAELRDRMMERLGRLAAAHGRQLAV